MVGVFGVDVPDVLLVETTIADVADGFHGGEHGVVHVVVAVLAVASQAVEVLYAIEPFTDNAQLFVGSEISRIGFAYLHLRRSS